MPWLFNLRIRTGLYDFLRFNVPWLPGTVSALPIAVAILFGYLLGEVGQMHEIYLTMIENGEWLRASIGYAVVVLLAVGLQQRTPTSYRRLHPAGSRSRFQRRAQSGAECGPLRSGDRLRRGAACRAGLGAIRMRGRLRETSDSYTEATRRRRRGRLEIPFSDRGVESALPIEALFDRGGLYIAVAALGLLGFLAWCFGSWRQRRDPRRSVRLFRILVIVYAVVAIFGLLILPVLSPGLLLLVSQGLGPLAMVGLHACSS